MKDLDLSENRVTNSNIVKIKKNDKIIGKISPKNLELEMTILGALMLEKDALSSVVDILKPETFYREAHQEIYNAIIQIFNDSAPVDIITVVEKLRKNGKLEFVGGAHYITSLTNALGSSANIEEHARILLEFSIRRNAISLSNKIQSFAYDDTKDIFDIIDKAEQELFDVGESLIKGSYKGITALLKQAYKELDNKRNQKDGIIGVPSGFISIDKVTQGWQKSELIIIAARPGMGKTAFLLSLIRNAAVDHNIPGAIFSLEMSNLQLINRMIASEAEIESEKLKKGSLADHEWEQLIHKTNKISQSNIFIDDTPALSIFDLRAKCRRLKAKHDIQFIVIDYLQLMSGYSGKNMGNREQEIAAISRALKCIAKELDVPVIAASQLSRSVETRGGDKRPQLADLRESGSIEQDADMVMFLYRPEYYGLNEKDDGTPLDNGYTELIIGKHRNGPLKTIGIKFINRFTKFTDLNNGFSSNENLLMSKINTDF
ncbi:MAG: replicative DNA helicase [Bacteroidetes bacterium]|nr:replicative DNA helicase [Bacteroidota bacterium]